MRRSTPLAAALAALLVGAMSCDPPGVNAGQRAPGQAASGGERRGGGDGGAPRVVEPPLPEDELARRGHTIFDAACGGCHNGESPSGGALANIRLEDARMNQVLHAGSDVGGLMPAVSPSVMTERDIPAVNAYLRTIHALR